MVEFDAEYSCKFACLSDQVEFVDDLQVGSCTHDIIVDSSPSESHDTNARYDSRCKNFDLLGRPQILI